MNPALRFALPVTMEHALAIATSQLTTSLVGLISGVSLAAVGTVNTLITFTTAAFAMINTGSAVLISRRIGAGDARGAAETLEQSISLLLLASSAVAALFLAAGSLVLRLLMPTAEDQLMSEALLFLRFSAVSFPFLMLETLLAGAQRAAGNSRAAMALGVGMNALLALLAFIFIPVMKLGIRGAGFSYVAARVAGAAAASVMTIRYHDRFALRAGNVLHPKLAAWKGIFRMGAPISAESVFVQGGYLMANSLVIGLGTFNATVYQVCTAVNNFTWMPNSVCSATAQTMVAMRLGEGNEKEAKRVAVSIWRVGAISVLTIGLAMAICARGMASIYTHDGGIIAACVPILWLCVPMALPAMSINTTDATLRAGGDAKYVMMASLVGVWLIRLTLSWLLAYRLGMGVTGIYLANFASFLYRMAAGIIRFLGGKWIHREF